MSLEKYFIPFGLQKIIYSYWGASGRIHKWIEEKSNNDISPFVANTHTETSITGATMSLAFHEAGKIILIMDLVSVSL